MKKITRVTDVHTEHCCFKHGCKYGQLAQTPCTVTTGKWAWQSYPCEMCEENIAEVWEIAHLEDQVLSASKRIKDLENFISLLVAQQRGDEI